MLHEVHDVLRRLWRARLSTAGLVLLLTLSAAAFACVFSITWAMLWKPLPFKAQSELVNLTLRSSKMGIDLGWSAPYLDHIRNNTRQLASVLSYRTRDMQRSGPDGRAIEMIEVARLEPRILSELGASPMIGRPLTQEDADIAAERVALVTQTFWENRLQGSDAAIGTKLVLDGDPYTIVGVMPRSFSFPSPEVQLWVPYALRPEDVQLDKVGSFGNLRAIARLTPRSSYGAAALEIANLVARHEGLKPIADQIGLQFEVKPIRSIWVQDRAPSLLALLTAATLLLAVSIANAYSLFLVRQLKRRQEFALLEAVGETTGRRLRRIAIEALLISASAVALAALLMPVGLTGLAYLGVLPEVVGQPITADFATTLLLMAVCLISTAALASTALVFRNQRIYEVLRQSGGGQTVPGKLMVQKKILVVSQLAAVFVLLFVTALLMKSSYRLLHEQLGFESHGAVVGVLQPSTTSQGTVPDVVRQNLADWQGRIALLPGVESIGLSSSAPYGDSVNLQTYVASSGASRVAGSEDQAYVNYVSPQYAQALGLRLLKGRSLDAQDTQQDSAVVLVDRTISEKFSNGALGQTVSITSEENGEPRQYTIVGIVDTVRQRVVSTPDEYPSIYIPKSIPYALPGMPSTSVEFVARTNQPEALLGHITKITEIDASGLRISNFVKLEQRVADTVADRIKLSQLLQILGVSALMLAAAGLYALLAHMVISRRRELAIRKALGATPRNLLLESLARGLRLVIIGALTGLPRALLSGAWLRPRLYETSPFDPASAVLVLSVIALVGLIATLRPSISAANVNPIDALRSE